MASMTYDDEREGLIDGDVIMRRYGTGDDYADSFLDPVKNGETEDGRDHRIMSTPDAWK